ncbi:MAG: antibiotic biosynthesis monooxygenase [Silvibacterium sp.]
MDKLALLATLQAKPGKEKEVAEFLKSALPLVEAEPETNTWFALQLGPSTFGIFDTFAAESGRDAHLSGKVAAALMQKAPELLAEAPKIQKVDILTFKPAK